MPNRWFVLSWCKLSVVGLAKMDVLHPSLHDKKGPCHGPKILRALDLDNDLAGVDVERVRALAMVAVQYLAHVFGNAVHGAAYCVIDVQKLVVAVVVDAGGGGVNVIDVKCHNFSSFLFVVAFSAHLYFTTYPNRSQLSLG